jgi:hypothetical protein
LLRASSPAGSFLGGFRTPAAMHLARLSLAGIRNPYMSANLSRPVRTVPIKGHILLFEPLQSLSFRPDPQSLKAVAAQGQSRMAVVLIVPRVA